MSRAKGPSTRIVGVEDRKSGSARVRFVRNGVRGVKAFGSGDAARKWARAFTREAAIEAGPTLAMLYQEYIEHRTELGVGSEKLPLMRDMLSELMVEVASTISTDEIVACYERYREMPSQRTGKRRSVATLRLVLGDAVRMFDYAVEKKYVTANPAKGIKVKGKVNRRKQQIETMDTLLRYRDALWRLDHPGTRAALVCLYLALRPGEVLAMEGRDVDKVDLGHVVIRGSKTDGSYRHLRVYDQRLLDMLLRCADAAPGTAKLFKVGERVMRTWVKRAAKVAGVESYERIMAHSLRGMAASMATRGDAAGRVIADLMGHASYATTKAHYATPSSQAQAAANIATKALTSGERMGVESFPEAAS